MQWRFDLGCVGLVVGVLYFGVAKSAEFFCRLGRGTHARTLSLPLSLSVTLSQPSKRHRVWDLQVVKPVTSGQMELDCGLVYLLWLHVQHFNPT